LSATIERCSSGIKELDIILGGGFPRGSLILVAGNPGTGKTILSTQFIYDGLKAGEKAVYASFLEPTSDHLRNMRQLGMDLEEFERKGLLKLMSFPTMERAGMNEAVSKIMEEAINFGAKRLVVDSISAILQVSEADEVRIFIQSVFSRLVKSAGITAILISEIPFGIETIGTGSKEFISDGIIILKSSLGRPTEKKELEVAKMRGTNIERPTFEYLIDEKYGGISLIMLPFKAAIDTAPKDKLRSGIEELDKMLFGGFLRDSITLIIGDAGVGKTTLCLESAIHQAQQGAKVLFLTWEETVGQIKRMLDNYGMDYKAFSDRFVLDAYVPEALTPLHYYKIMKDYFDHYKPSFIVFDSISSIQPTLPPAEYLAFLRYLQLLCKERHATALLTVYSPVDRESKSNMSVLADNIISMRHLEFKGEFRHTITVVKTRSSAHSEKTVPFKIKDRGISFHSDNNAGE
jgi:circadian clock protein KaiC